MRRPLYSANGYRLPSIFSVIFLAGLGLAACETDTVLQSDANNNTIHVSGTGSVTAIPDVANAYLGVQNFANRADSAIATNNDLIAGVIVAVKKLGVPTADIQTAAINLYAQRNYDKEQEPTVTGYWANNSVRVVIRDLQTTGLVLQTAIDAGANSVNSLFFTISNADELRQEARAAAVYDARSKAETLADAAGAKVGDVLSIREFSGGSSVFSRAAFEGDSVMAVPVEPGELSVTAQVEVVFELR